MTDYEKRLLARIRKVADEELLGASASHIFGAADLIELQSRQIRELMDRIIELQG